MGARRMGPSYGAIRYDNTDQVEAPFTYWMQSMWYIPPMLRDMARSLWWRCPTSTPCLIGVACRDIYRIRDVESI